MDAIDKDLFDYKLRQPASKKHWEIPDDSRGIKTGIGALY